MKLTISKLAFLVALIPLVTASPVNAKAVTICDDHAPIAAEVYTLSLNPWGKRDAIKGSTCAQLISVQNGGKDVVWSNAWNWVGGKPTVKSYTNLALRDGLNKKVSAIHSIQSSWSWVHSHSSSSIVSNVAYDLFTAATPGGKNENEVMFWLANYSAKALSFKYGADGKPIPIQSNIPIANHTWNLYSGSNGYNKVFSFLPSRGPIPSFSGNLKEFLAVNDFFFRVKSPSKQTSPLALGLDQASQRRPVPHHIPSRHRSHLGFCHIENYTLQRVH